MKIIIIILSFVFGFIVFISCEKKETLSEFPTANGGDDQIINGESDSQVGFYLGADLSYVNEMIDCGAVFRNSNNEIKNPYSIFKNAGANLIRVRLWHNPEWTAYSNFEDVTLTIKRAREENMKVLLDFHYSDTWADPHKQQIPEAWKEHINDREVLGNLLYDYTYSTLTRLAEVGLLPEMVQVGNEINPMILQDGELKWPIDWERNSYLINKGIEAVRTVSKEQDTELEVMLHIAQPENGIWWFKEATESGISDFDWIGLSYYPKWSEYDLNDVENAFRTLIQTYKKRLMVVETAYPFTMENADTANNILGNDALVPGYPATEQGQLDYLIRLKKSVKDAGGEGLIYWEPAWVSTDCETLWGTGSHWDNTTLFDHDNRVTKGIQFYMD
ncbi:arabinogalactan endo-1,4-beta-galactosidase [Lutimonas saemankumensis]|uniref:glycoside hydrolase family 53 protein n=1 Tax=Lutimonas saemankumensis TaxID=483016 RepID=UPI001CD72C13|nr:glycosyl hydrolase 53 family protein [Lutimonas saemankumensis]MCA0930880.1 arabinogalactan endo-1,4-beta-galactosidase [Lutimonas saemankumensis]